MMALRNWKLLVAAIVAAVSGCAHLSWHAPIPPGTVLLPNPLIVPNTDREFLWTQIIDTLDDHFRIEREERLRVVGGVLTDGRIETFPTTAATVLEPWRGDSSPGFEKWHATLHSVRRRASVRVSTAENGYSIELAVYKEIEDLAQPEHATIGSATLRHDGSLVRNESPALGGAETLGWIPIGRDPSLEQRLLAELQARLAASMHLPTQVRRVQP